MRELTMVEKQMKKAYVSPELTVFGDVEKVTLGSGSLTYIDFLIFGFSDPRGIPFPTDGLGS
jgi:hypothetical protein